MTLKGLNFGLRTTRQAVKAVLFVSIGVIVIRGIGIPRIVKFTKNSLSEAGNLINLDKKNEFNLQLPKDFPFEILVKNPSKKRLKIPGWVAGVFSGIKLFLKKNTDQKDPLYTPSRFINDEIDIEELIEWFETFMD